MWHGQCSPVFFVGLALQYCKMKHNIFLIFDKNCNSFSFLQKSTTHIGHKRYMLIGSFNYWYTQTAPKLYLWTLMSLSKYFPESTLVIIFRKILNILMTHLGLISSVRNWVICTFYVDCWPLRWSKNVLKIYRAQKL